MASGVGGAAGPDGVGVAEGVGVSVGLADSVGFAGCVGCAGSVGIGVSVGEAVSVGWADGVAVGGSDGVSVGGFRSRGGAGRGRCSRRGRSRGAASSAGGTTRAVGAAPAIPALRVRAIERASPTTATGSPRPGGLGSVPRMGHLNCGRRTPRPFRLTYIAGSPKRGTSDIPQIAAAEQRSGAGFRPWRSPMPPARRLREGRPVGVITGRFRRGLALQHGDADQDCREQGVAEGHLRCGRPSHLIGVQQADPRQRRHRSPRRWRP